MPAGLKITQYPILASFGNPMNAKLDVSRIPPNGANYETESISLSLLEEFWKPISSETTNETVGNFSRAKKTVAVYGRLNDAGTDYVIEPTHTTESTKETRFAYDSVIIDRVLATETRLCIFNKYPVGKPIKRTVFNYGATLTYSVSYISAFTIS